MNTLPTKEENPQGLPQRYIAQKADGSPVDPAAEYFVLRLDDGGTDPKHVEACRKAIMEYADQIRPHRPRLALDIHQRYAYKTPTT